MYVPSVLGRSLDTGASVPDVFWIVLGCAAILLMIAAVCCIEGKED